MSARNVYISRRNFMKAGAVAAAMASLGVPAMAAPAGEENCLWSNITPRRSTQYGPVVGLDQGESLVWYGIPYGAAPVGAALAGTAGSCRVDGSQRLHCSQ